MIKTTDVLILLGVFIVAAAGSVLTSNNLDWYYEALRRPAWTPLGSVIGLAWTLIFILVAVAAVILWHQAVGTRRRIIFSLLFVNGILNICWTYLFFSRHLLGASVVEMIVLNATTVVIAWLSWSVSRLASVLLWPYITWVTFATYLAYAVWRLNLG